MPARLRMRCQGGCRSVRCAPGFLPVMTHGVVGQPFDLGKDLDCRSADVDGLGAGLGIGKVKRHPLEIHIVPFEGHDLGEAAAGEDQEPQGVDGRPALYAFLLALPQGFTEPRQLPLRKVALPFLLRVLSYVHLSRILHD